MSKIKLVIAAFAAVLAVGAVASTTAFAATEGWMVNGTMLSGSKKLMTTGKVTSPGKLASASVEVECTGSEIGGVAPEIVAPNKGGASSVVFKECGTVGASSAVCTLNTKTLSTVPVLLTELTLDGTLAVKGAVVPETKSEFAKLTFTGGECAVAGTQPVTGKVLILAHLGQDEMTWQPVLLFSDTGALKLGSGAATLTGAGELATENLEPWSFL